MKKHCGEMKNKAMERSCPLYGKLQTVVLKKNLFRKSNHLAVTIQQQIYIREVRNGDRALHQ